jgi:hypothetical protein
MRLWPRSTTDRIREAFAFLIEAGYRLVSESGLGMGVTVTYRSPALWIAVNADRGDAWVEVTPTGQPDDPVTDDVLRELVAGHTTYEAKYPLGRAQSVEETAAFVREHVDELERRFGPEYLAVTRKGLAALCAARAAKTKAWLAGSDRRGAGMQGR